MKRLSIGAIVALLAACHTDSELVYSSGFSFARYEFVIISKPDGLATSALLYGMDVELANLLTRYNMKVVGNKEYETLTPEEKSKTMFARMALNASKKKMTVTVSFDDMVSGRTGATVTTYADGNIFDNNSRTEAFNDAAKPIRDALQHDKGLTISNTNIVR